MMVCLQLTVEKSNIPRYDKSDLGGSDLLGRSTKTEVIESNPILTERPNFHKGSPVSKERFIKFIPSEKSAWLRAKYPFAFLLLNLIAERVRRTDDPFGDLKMGECYIGDFESIGCSRQNYRTALTVLLRQNFISILQNSRNRKKSTTASTTVGTKVKLLNSDIWDVNLNVDNHCINHCPTTVQPLSNHKQECKERKNVKKEEEQQAASAADLRDPPPKRQRLKEEFSPEVIDTAEALIECMKETKPDYSPPKNLFKLYREVDLAIRTQGREPEKLIRVFRWALADSFWSAKMFKPNPAAYLREKFDFFSGPCSSTCKCNRSHSTRKKWIKEEKINSEIQY